MQESTALIEGAGKKEEIQARVKQLQAQIADTSSDYDRDGTSAASDPSGAAGAAAAAALQKAQAPIVHLRTRRWCQGLAQCLLDNLTRSTTCVTPGAAQAALAASWMACQEGA